jgi:hypothetical protein
MPPMARSHRLPDRRPRSAYLVFVPGLISNLELLGGPGFRISAPAGDVHAADPARQARHRIERPRRCACAAGPKRAWTIARGHGRRRRQGAALLGASRCADVGAVRGDLSARARARCLLYGGFRISTPGCWAGRALPGFARRRLVGTGASLAGSRLAASATNTSPLGGRVSTPGRLAHRGGRLGA